MQGRKVRREGENERRKMETHRVACVPSSSGKGEESSGFLDMRKKVRLVSRETSGGRAEMLLSPRSKNSRVWRCTR